jgi:acid phosphatase type 7
MSRFPTLALLLALTSAAPCAAADLVRGPYLQQVTAESAIVVFDLDEAVEAEVQLTAGSGEYEHTFSSAAGLHHEVSVTGLEADTSYRYGVCIDDVEMTEGLQFTTVPDVGSDLTFLVFGDTRSGHDEHQSVIDVMSEEDVMFVVHTGDLVASGDDLVQWDTFFAIEGDLLSRLAMYPVPGNHDEADGEAVDYQDAFALPGNELYYSFDVGNTHFVMLDQYVSSVLACVVDEALVDNCLDEEQVAWLEADLAAASTDADIDVIFVIAHQGPYSSKDGRAGSMHLRVLMPLFAAHGVAAFLTGHDHYYERGLSENGIPYAITGGGGAGLYEIGTPSSDPHTVIHNAMVNHFLVVEVSGTVVRLSAKTPDGVVIDEVEYDAADLIPPAGDDDDDDDAGPAAGIPLSEAPDCSCGNAPRTSGPSLTVAVLLLLLGGALRRCRH